MRGPVLSKSLGSILFDFITVLLQSVDSVLHCKYLNSNGLLFVSNEKHGS